VTTPDFERFARAELPRLLRYAVMLTGERDLAQDLVQDVLVKAHGEWARVSAAQHPERYITRMLTHAFLSWRRRWSVRHIFATAELDERLVADDHTSQHAERDDLWRRLGKLPPRQRAVLVLRYYEGLPDNEIAAILGCASTTVRGYAHRGLAALRLDLTDRSTHSSATPIALECR
jgi:RNA polymerase sigma-70 factor (sigma-E family)